MAGRTERLEVRLPPEMAQRLRREAERRRTSLAQVVRTALERWLQEEGEARQRAAEAPFQVEAPVADWDRMEREIGEAYTQPLHPRYRHGGHGL